MGLKDKIKLFPWDKLSHYQWASWFAVCASCVGIPTLRYEMDMPMWGALLGSGVLAIVIAYIAGKGGEEFDRQANRAAEAAGKPLPHEVSRGDVNASTLGGVAVGLPLLVAGVVAFVTK